MARGNIHPHHDLILPDAVLYLWHPKESTAAIAKRYAVNIAEGDFRKEYRLFAIVVDDWGNLENLKVSDKDCVKVCKKLATLYTVVYNRI
jgi:hypothetical protein